MIFFVSAGRNGTRRKAGSTDNHSVTFYWQRAVMGHTEHSRVTQLMYKASDWWATDGVTITGI